VATKIWYALRLIRQRLHVGELHPAKRGAAVVAPLFAASLVARLRSQRHPPKIFLSEKFGGAETHCFGIHHLLH
jgi:hypothetical protein